MMVGALPLGSRELPACVTRAIAIATGLPYRQVYNDLNERAQRERPRGKRSRSAARTGVHKDTYRKYLIDLGWTWVPTMKIGQGCKVHLCAEELPHGTIIVKLSKHLSCVIDHVIYDSHDPQREMIELLGDKQRIIRRCVYGYYRKPTNA